MDCEKSLSLDYGVYCPGSRVNDVLDGPYQDGFGGVERTKKDWARLLAVLGLRLAKVWRAKGVLVGVVEARLK